MTTGELTAAAVLFLFSARLYHNHQGFCNLKFILLSNHWLVV